MPRRRSLWLLPAAIIAATAFAGAPALAQDDGEAMTEVPDTLVMGFVPSREADVLVTNIDPLVAYLSETLGMPVEGVVTQGYTGLVTAMETGQAHVGAFGSFGMVQAMDRAGVVPILQTQRDGEVTYHTQWFTNQPDKYCAEAPVDDVQEDGRVFLACNGLEVSDTEDGYTFGPKGEEFIAKIEAGTTVSFTTPTSGSGYVFPALQLINLAGLDPETDVAASFAGGHDNSILAVCNGDAEVGVAFDDARRIIQEGDCDDLSQVVTFAFSDEIPSDGIAVAGSLPAELQQAIADALVAYADTPEGAAVLDAVYEIDTYGIANAEAYDVVRDAAAKLGIVEE
jgi:phosphonate transport system substrate-binding protein